MSDYSKIKSVVFDFGGVIIDLYPNKTFGELRNRINPIHESSIQKLALELEVGKVTGKEFIDELKKLFDSKISNEEVVEIWNRMLCEVDLEKVKFLNNLKKSYKIYLLSNTNIIHKEFFDVICNKAFGTSMEEYFEKTIYSHEIKLRKPNKEIFQYLVDQVNLEADEILFIDDLEENILNASSLGIKTHLFKRNSKFTDLNYLITNH